PKTTSAFSIVKGSKEIRIPTKARKVADVSGAGDTVISTLTYALTAGASIEEAAYIANYAGGLVCEEVGIVPIESDKLFSVLRDLKLIRYELKQKSKKVVFTNGCFDVLHAGHVDYLAKAKECGDILIVGLNSDSSVREIKGKNRPIVTELERAFILTNLKSVDFVILFGEPTPKELIDELIPDVLIKGADWAIENIVGREIVEANGGSVQTIKFVTQQSTTNIIEKVLAIYNE
ncbi:unnamed protein product, partial [Cyprideis torosa]